MGTIGCPRVAKESSSPRQPQTFCGFVRSVCYWCSWGLVVKWGQQTPTLGTITSSGGEEGLACGWPMGHKLG